MSNTPDQVPVQSRVVREIPLGFPWETRDPFLFCVHHEDFYPQGNEQMGPRASLAGRNLGQDFTVKDGFRMYHGEVVPGFPQHPHRGFETITIARRGFIDHSDSLGAAARFGTGDVQWMTAGKGIVHSEMFPLISETEPNTVELFQIWLNLPAADKMVDPHFKMLWAESLPRVVVDAAGSSTVTVIAGQFAGQAAPSPPPSSWASKPEAEIAIFAIVLGPNGTVALPTLAPGVERTLYFFKGPELVVNGQRFGRHVGLEVSPGEQTLTAGEHGAEILVLQGRPLRERVAQYGPFVMNTQAELQQAFVDYRRTQFGGWPWPEDAPVHPRAEGRFARHVDGRLERPEIKA
jgi:quercetin 2,3-dioxygenase